MSLSETDIHSGRINDQLGSQLEGLSAQMEAGVERGRSVLAEWQANLSDKFSEAASSADQYARENPWPLVCGAMVFGLALGALCGRR